MATAPRADRLADVGEEVLEAQAVEEPVGSGALEADAPRPLPDVQRRGDVDVWRDEVRSVAVAAAGGIVAGAATVAVVRAVSRPTSSARKGLRRKAKGRDNIIASRSFLVDVHVLGR
jgi:hypothetical protein